MTDLADRSVIVVGATGGLGLPIARALSAQGCRLTLVGRDADRVRDTGVPGVAVGVDVRKAASAPQIVEAAIAGTAAWTGSSSPRARSRSEQSTNSLTR